MTYKLLLILIFIINVFQVSFANESLQDFVSSLNLKEEVSDEFFSNYPELLNESVVFSKSISSSESNFKFKLYFEKSSEVKILKRTGNKLEIEELYRKFNAHEQIVTLNGSDLFLTMMNFFSDEEIAWNIYNGYKTEIRNSNNTKFNFNIEIKYALLSEDDLDVHTIKILETDLVVGSASSKKEINSLGVLEAKKILESEKVFSYPIKREEGFAGNMISSHFSLARRHPVKRRVQPHNGVDFRAQSGTAIYPAYSGVILEMGRTRAKGNYILIEHENGFVSTYDHLRRFSKNLTIGMFVNSDEVIGEVGRTGYATGAHLHFGLIKDGHYVNPLYYFKSETDFSIDSYEEFIEEE